jgi:P2 family phage major capsid protein
MKNDTRKLFKQYQTGMATANGVEDMAQTFSVDIPKETKLNNKIQESAAFLNLITMTGVTDSEGQALELGVQGLIGKRTDIPNSSGGRQPTNAGAIDGTPWKTAFTEFDVAVGYGLLDVWARYPDFHKRIMNAIYNQIAMSRISVGFYGVTAAAQTNPATNPLGQDVNKGWIASLKEHNAEAVLLESSVGTGKITIGAAGDYKNIDALVYDLYSSIAVEHRTGNEVVIIGASLVAADMNKGISAHAGTPSEKTNIQWLANSYGGLKAIQVPKFPDMGVMVTDPKNLQLLYQEGKTRRATEDEPKYNRVVDYISSNDAYAIGNVNAIRTVEAANVEFKETV